MTSLNTITGKETFVNLMLMVTLVRVHFQSNRFYHHFKDRHTDLFVRVNQKWKPARQPKVLEH